MSTRRSARLLGALLVSLALAATGCGAGDAKDNAVETRVVKADNGDITIPAKPKRVIATGYAVPVLIESGAPLVGVSSWTRGLPLMSATDRASYDGLKKVAGEQAKETNYEAIANAQPDLIVIGVPAPVLGDIDLARLKTVAPVVAIGPTVPSAWKELSRRQADAAGALTGFDAAQTKYQARAAELGAKYKGVLPQLKLGHLGAYGEVAKGQFQHEFNGSWGTNIAQDIGANYYGQVKKKGGGSKDVSEASSIEELTTAYAEADAISYSVKPDGSVPPPVQYVLDSGLWKNLPAVKAGRVYPFRLTEAATYTSALQTLDAIDTAFTPLLAK
ncbi:ABC transporter substrate-binding protein [Crossiella sp. CA198]|uniref:ABC transporter substrate-binding protein n=1 Tax=Crossiella sp. CA198 TaxID=3455607 RepID=UPI003F8D6487